jgi:hypothetical protein
VKAEPIPGWKGKARAPDQLVRLTSAGVIAGSPDDEAQAMQIGDQTRTRDGLKIRFHDLNKFMEPEPKWVYCQYGTDVRMQLLREVPISTDICVADIRKDARTVTSIKIICR